jgi:hypothetical protein
MKYLDIGETSIPDARASGGSADAVEAQLGAQQDRLRELTGASPAERAAAQLEIARTLIALDRGAEAWRMARDAFDAHCAAEDWEPAVEACDLLFRAEQPGSLAALGQGIWLAVTYPVDPELTAMMLAHVVDETPDDSDGAAVAAAAATYVVDLRATEEQAKTLRFFASQLLGRVAKRHGQVETQEQFAAWFRRLELGEPERFLPRLRNVVDVLVQDDWWFDRASLQAKLPVN